MTATCKRATGSVPHIEIPDDAHTQLVGDRNSSHQRVMFEWTVADVMLAGTGEKPALRDVVIRAFDNDDTRRLGRKDGVCGGWNDSIVISIFNSHTHTGEFLTKLYAGRLVGYDVEFERGWQLSESFQAQAGLNRVETADGHQYTDSQNTPVLKLVGIKSKGSLLATEASKALPSDNPFTFDPDETATIHLGECSSEPSGAIPEADVCPVDDSTEDSDEGTTPISTDDGVSESEDQPDLGESVPDEVVDEQRASGGYTDDYGQCFESEGIPSQPEFVSAASSHEKIRGLALA